MSLEAINNFYLSLSEPNRSCMLAFRDVIVDFDPGISQEWKYRLPFFYLHKRMFCYLWMDKKTSHPYVGIVDGHLIDHPMLVQGDRKRMKVLPVDPNEDIPLQALREILWVSRELRSKS